MTLANGLRAWSASKSGRNLLDANVMPSPCNVLVTCVWALLLSNARLVVGLKGGKELDNVTIRTIGGENAADVWIPRFVFNHKTICAGVTLTAEADLTSATCLKDDEPLEAFVVVESRGQNEPPVQVAHIDHCVKFDRDDQHVHDLMVCFHRCQWNFSDDVFVPRINLDSHRVPSGSDKTCSVMGFGHLTPEGDKCNVLHTLEISVGTAQDCGSQDSTVQNYICGATTEHQDSCAVDGGEPLLCQHDSSKFFIHGICKQEDCSAPQKYSKFILLSYYREWLERTVPGLAPSSGSQEEPSSHGEEGDPKSDTSATDVAAEGKTDAVEKCPVLPPVGLHVHHLPLTRQEHTTQSSDDTPSSAPQSSNGDTPHATESEIESYRQSANLDYSGAAQSFVGASVGSDGSDPNGTGLPSDDTPQAAPSESGNATLHNTSPADDETPLNATTVRTSPGDLATVVPPNSADSVLNVTVLLASLSDGWYLSNATHSAPHLSDSNEKLDLEQFEKLISDNGDLLNISYVVDSYNLSLPGYRKRSVETAPVLLSASRNELAKSGAQPPNSIPATETKSTSHSAGKPGQTPVDVPKPQNALPSAGVTPVQDRGRTQLPHTAAPRDNASRSATPAQNLTTEAPQRPEISQPAPHNSITLTPSQWAWIKQNAMRLPKNPLKNPRILGKKLLFKPSRNQFEPPTKAPVADQRWSRQEKGPMASSERSGFPSTYRAKWSAQSLPYSHLRPSDDMKMPQINQSHTPRKGMPKRDLSSRTTLSRFANRLSWGRSPRSLPSTETHPAKAVDTRIWRNAIEKGGDVHRAHPIPTKERQLSSSSGNRRQPEGTVFGVLSSSDKKRLRRSDEPEDWKTLLADLASWPAHVGIAPSQLTPPMSFLTTVDDNFTHMDSGPVQTYSQYFKMLRAFLPGGDISRRIDMSQKKLPWGRPITYDEFKPIRPWNVDARHEGKKVVHKKIDVGERLGPDENTASATESPENRLYGTDEPKTTTAAHEHAERKAREVKNELPTTPGLGMQHGTDGVSIGAVLEVKNENHTAGGHNNSHNGSPNGTNVSDRPDRGTGAGTNDARKETTLPVIDTQEKTSLPTVHTRKETTIPAADTEKEVTLSPVNKENDSLRSTTDAQKETTLSKVDTGRETKDAVVVSTPLPVDLSPTVRRTIEFEESSEERYSTSLGDDDTDREPVQGPDEQVDLYDEIKRLGADDPTNAASASRLALTLLLTWIFMPQM